MYVLQSKWKFKRVGSSELIYYDDLNIIVTLILIYKHFMFENIAKI